MNSYNDDHIKAAEKREIDLLAVEYYKAKQRDDLAAMQAQSGEIYDILLKCYKHKHTDENRILYEDAFTDAVLDSLEKYDPEKGDYSNFFTVVFKSKREDVFRKEFRHNKNRKVMSADRESGGKKVREQEPEQEQEKYFSDKGHGDPAVSFIIEMKIMQMCDVVLSQQKENKRKSGQLYYPMIFTDDMVRLIHSGIAVYNTIENNSARLNRATHSDFMSFFLTKECEKLEDSFGANVRMLSDITGDPADSGKDCRSRNSPHRLEQKVYAKYAGVSVQSMVDPMKKYDEIISIIKF